MLPTSPIATCESKSVRRFIMLDSMNTAASVIRSESLQHYLTARKGADNRQRKTPLNKVLNSI